MVGLGASLEFLMGIELPGRGFAAAVNGGSIAWLHRSAKSRREQARWYGRPIAISAPEN
jgi:hypothetical protein